MRWWTSGCEVTRPGGYLLDLDNRIERIDHPSYWRYFVVFVLRWRGKSSTTSTAIFCKIIFRLTQKTTMILTTASQSLPPTSRPTCLYLNGETNIWHFGLFILLSCSSVYFCTFAWRNDFNSFSLSLLIWRSLYKIHQEIENAHYMITIINFLNLPRGILFSQ